MLPPYNFHVKLFRDVSECVLEVFGSNRFLERQKETVLRFYSAVFIGGVLEAF
jgi:hypothetical protein